MPKYSPRMIPSWDSNRLVVGSIPSAYASNFSTPNSKKITKVLSVRVIVDCSDHRLLWQVNREPAVKSGGRCFDPGIFWHGQEEIFWPEVQKIENFIIFGGNFSDPEVADLTQAAKKLGKPNQIIWSIPIPIWNVIKMELFP